MREPMSKVMVMHTGSLGRGEAEAGAFQGPPGPPVYLVSSRPMRDPISSDVNSTPEEYNIQGFPAYLTCMYTYAHAPTHIQCCTHIHKHRKKEYS